MIALIGGVTKAIKKVPGGPIVQAVVTVAFLLVAYYVIRSLFNTVGRLLNPPVNPQDLVDETPTQDNTDLTEPEEDAFALTAETIAQGQYNNMVIWGTNETALFNALVNLNGGQLQAVYAAFGIRDGKNLFDWYADELQSNAFGFGGVYWCGATGMECEDAEVPGCETWADSCYEADFMRAIWQKSGLPITF